MLDINSKIFVAGHNGLVGSAIWNNLLQREYTNLVGRNHKELDSDCSGGRTAMQFDTASQNE